MVGVDFESYIPAKHHHHASQPPLCLCTDRFPLPLLSTHSVLPSSAPALLEYGVNRLSIVDYTLNINLEHAINTKASTSTTSTSTSQVRLTPICPTNDFQNENLLGAGGKAGLFPLSGGEPDQENQGENCIDDNAVSDNLERACPFRNSSQSPQLCGNGNYNNMIMISTETCSQNSNSNSLFGENKSQHITPDGIQINQQPGSNASSSSTNTNDDDADVETDINMGLTRPNITSCEESIVSVVTESEQVERIRFCGFSSNVESQGKSEALAVLAIDRASAMSACLSDRCLLVSPNVSNIDENTLPVMSRDTYHYHEVTHVLSEGKIKEEPYKPGDRSFQNKVVSVGHCIKNEDWFEESYLKNTSGTQRDVSKITDIKNKNGDFYLIASSTNADNTSRQVQPSDTDSVVTPEIYSSLTVNVDRNIELKKALAFDSNEDGEISFSPLCGENEGSKMEMEGHFTPKDNKKHIRHTENDGTTCKAIDVELCSWQNESNNGVKDCADHNINTSPEELTTDVKETTSSQHFSVKSPEMSFVQKAKSNRRIVISPKNTEQELNFSPLYSQAYSLNDVEEHLNQNDTESSYSQMSCRLIKFSPLKNIHLAFERTSSLENVGNLTNGLQSQPEEDFSKLKSRLDQQGKMQLEDFQRHMESSKHTIGFCGELLETEIDDRCCDSESNTTLNKEKENESDCRNSNESNISLDLDAPNTYSTEETHALVVFSPLVEKECQIDNYFINNSNGQDFSSSLKEQGKVNGAMNQVVPNYELKQINQQRRETNAYTEENYRSKLGITRAIQLNQQNDSETAKCEKESIKKRVDVETHNDDIVLDNANDENNEWHKVKGVAEDENDIFQSKVLNEITGGRDNLNQSHNIIPEQEVPENIFVKGLDGCHDQSLYDKESIKYDGGQHSVREPYRPSFQWKSVYEAVLVKNNNGNAQQVTGDHLESIIPLPLPSQLKRPRSLRVGLSKKQKVRHLHEK